MLNSVQLMGRLTADPVRSVTATGKEKCTFTIAVDRYISQGERKADFINIVTWGSTAVHVEKYFRKGSMIALDGAIRTYSYEDKKGYKRTRFEVEAREVYFCGSKSEGSSKPSKPSDEGEQPTSAGLNGYFATATAADFEEICCDDDDYEVSV